VEAAEIPKGWVRELGSPRLDACLCSFTRAREYQIAPNLARGVGRQGGMRGGAKAGCVRSVSGRQATSTQRRFLGAVGSEEGEHLAPLDGEADPGKRFRRPEALRDNVYVDHGLRNQRRLCRWSGLMRIASCAVIGRAPRPSIAKRNGRRSRASTAAYGRSQSETAVDHERRPQHASRVDAVSAWPGDAPSAAPRRRREGRTCTMGARGGSRGNDRPTRCRRMLSGTSP